jgi:hypothetical protein
MIEHMLFFLQLMPPLQPQLSLSLCNHADNIFQKTTSAICCIDGDGDDAHGNAIISKKCVCAFVCECACVRASLYVSVSLCPPCVSDSWLVAGFNIYHHNSVSFLHVSGISVLKSCLFAPAVVAGGGGSCSQWHQRQEDHVLDSGSSRRIMYSIAAAAAAAAARGFLLLH